MVVILLRIPPLCPMFKRSCYCFQADVDGDRFIDDLSRVLSRPTAYDAVMRVRTSTGVRATDFYGHFFMSNTTDVELATLGKNFILQFELDPFCKTSFR